MTAEMERPLAGLRVVDCASFVLCAIGRMLAELGAEVVRIEPRAGGPDRAGGLDSAGLGFLAGNLGKRSVALDLADAADRATFHALVAVADVLIETTSPGSAAARLMDAAGLSERHAALVVLSATPFGVAGAASAWQATDPVFNALSGVLSRSGIPGRAPVLPPGELASQCATTQALYVILLAYVQRLRTGLGDHLDFSVLEGASQTLDPGFGIAGSAANGVPASALPRGRVEARQNYPIIPCADGYVRLCVLSARQWLGMFEWMGRPAQFADPSYRRLQTRFADPDLVPAITRLFAGQTRQALEAQGQRFGVPAAAVLSLNEALGCEQLRVRGALRAIDAAPGHGVTLPNGALEIDGARMGGLEPAPALDADGPMIEAIMARWRAAPAPSGLPPAGRPLAGLKVLDFGVIVVGAEQGRLLADQGAEVIKIESAAFPDGSRQDRQGNLIAPTFVPGHFNKRSLGINLRDPRGRDLLLGLVDRADIMVSNFKPGTLAALGLDPVMLAARNPRLIMVESAAFGPSGPWSARLGYGPLVRAATGLTEQWADPDAADGFSDTMTVYPDHTASRIGAAAALALLIRRARTGRGGLACVAQNEVMLTQMPARVAAAGLGCDDRAPPDAPWGVFACAGEDEWCVVTCRDGADFRALCAVMERSDLAADAGLQSPAGRIAERERVDAVVAAFLAPLTPRAAMARLQAAGVPAGAMLRVAELPAFEAFAARGAFRLVRHPHLADPFQREAAPVRARRLQPPPDAPAPLLGEHTVEIARDTLDLDDAEIALLIEAGILEVPAIAPDYTPVQQAAPA